MPFTLSASVDTAAFRRQVEHLMRTQIRPGIVDALNDVAEAVEKGLTGELSKVFDRPNPFTQASIGLYEATLRDDGGKVSALVYVKDRAAEYLDIQVEGGSRVAGDPFTTSQGAIVPGKNAPRDQFGNLPRNYVRDMLRQPDVELCRILGDGGGQAAR